MTTFDILVGIAAGVVGVVIGVAFDRFVTSRKWRGWSLD